MAQIKMDVSEYEVMKENASLLKASLKKEEDLNKEIKDLKNEKIKILEENDKVVTTVLVKRTAETKASYLPQHEIIRRIQQGLQKEREGRNDFMHDRYMHNREMEMMSMGGSGMYSFFDSFFETKTHEFETSKEITRKGLDEVISELKIELKRELDQTVQEQLEQLKKLITERTNWYIELTEAREFGKAKDKEATKLSELLEEDTKKITDYRKQIFDFNKFYNDINIDNLTIWNVSKFKKDYKKLKENDKG